MPQEILRCSHPGCAREASHRNPLTGEVFCEDHIHTQLSIITGDIIDPSESTWVEDVAVFNQQTLSGYVSNIYDLPSCSCGRKVIPQAMHEGYCSFCIGKLKYCERCDSNHDNPGDYCNICEDEMKLPMSPKKIDKAFLTRKILDYNYQPKFWPVWGSKNSRIFGLEIEVTSKDSGGLDLMRSQLGSFALFEHDGSVEFQNDEWEEHDGEAFEIVTPPAAKSVISHFAKKMGEVEEEYEHEDNTSCGIHVHVSRKSFSNQYHIAKFLTFFAKYPKFTHIIGEREPNHYSRNEITGNVVGKAKNGGGEKYDAVNLRHKKSVEIRIFRSSLRYKAIMKNVEFIDALITYTRDLHVENITQEGFLTFVREEATGVNNLKEFINKTIK